MSSIYKKGRDGYYYYQTYTYNHKTGRRDKKIYHSLGTKDESEARAKQNNLDSKYSKKSKTSFLKILSTNNNKVRLKALLIFFSMVFPISLAFLLRTKPQKITIEAEENTFKIISKINVPTKIKEKKDLPIDYIFKEDVIRIFNPGLQYREDR